MRAETHAYLMEISNLAMLVVVTPLACLFGMDWLPGNITPWLVFMGVNLAVGLILWFLPVRCPVLGCNGRMHKTATSLSTFKDRLHYRCVICGSVYETVILTMPSGDPIP